MPFQLIRGDITNYRCDAVVNAANSTLSGGGGVDGAIHRAAGPGLLAACRKLGGCPTGEARITRGYDLPAKYVIHTVGPVWQGGGRGEEALLRACYRNALSLAAGRRCRSVAFPLISAGAYGYPKEAALRVAMEEITAFLQTHEMQVALVLLDADVLNVNKARFTGLSLYLLDRLSGESGESLVCEERIDSGVRYSTRGMTEPETVDGPERRRKAARTEPSVFAELCAERIPSPEAFGRELDESFSEMLLRKIDEKGMTDAACYKKANVDRKLFSKIRSDKYYRPKKTTAIAFAVALELPLAEAEDLLRKAGFALSHSNRFDVIIEYFLSCGVYDVFEINRALFAYDQPLLGV